MRCVKVRRREQLDPETETDESHSDSPIQLTNKFRRAAEPQFKFFNAIISSFTFTLTFTDLCFTWRTWSGWCVWSGYDVKFFNSLLPDQAQIGVSGWSAAGILACPDWVNGCGPWLVIAPDKEAAAYFHNTLASLLPDSDILFIPDSFKRPGLIEEIVSSQVMERTEAVNKLYSNGLIGYQKATMVAVTYPEALVESVISPFCSKNKSRSKKANLAWGLAFVYSEAASSRVDFVSERNFHTWWNHRYFHSAMNGRTGWTLDER